jgi:hypothetical protein
LFYSVNPVKNTFTQLLGRTRGQISADFFDFKHFKKVFICNVSNFTWVAEFIFLPPSSPLEISGGEHFLLISSKVLIITCFEKTRREFLIKKQINRVLIFNIKN